MKAASIFLILHVLALVSFSQTVSPDDAFMELLKPDAKLTPATASPSEISLMLEKWKKYEGEQNQNFKDNILGARKIVAEMLAQKAAKAPANVRGRLLAEGERITKLDSEDDLTTIPGKDDVLNSAILGVWNYTPKWRSEYLPDGRTLQPDGRVGSWHWLDSDAKVVTHGRDGIDGWECILWLQKPGTTRALDSANNRNTLAKTAGPAALPTDPLIVSLGFSEITQRKTKSETLASQRKKVVAWLLAKAAKLPSVEVADLLKNIQEMEASADAASGNASKMAGVWKWENKEIVFQPYGVVTTKMGATAGSWTWIRKTDSHVAVVLNGGKTANDFYMAPPPADASQTSITVQRLGDGAFVATRSMK